MTDGMPDRGARPSAAPQESTVGVWEAPPSPADFSAPASGFPVVDVVALDRLPPRRWRRPRRRAEHVPSYRRATVQILQCNNAYHIFEPTMQLCDPLVVNASAVIYVSTATEIVESAVLLPSANRKIAIQIRARFHCRVSDPLLVLDQGCWDIQPFLADHLLGCIRLRMLCSDYDTDRSWQAFQRRLTAMLLAYGEMNPVLLAGVSATMADSVAYARPIDMLRTGQAAKSRFDGVTETVPVVPNQPASGREYQMSGSDPDSAAVRTEAPARLSHDGDPDSVDKRFTWEKNR